METDYGNKSYTTLDFFKRWSILLFVLLLVALMVEIYFPFPVFGYVLALIVILTLLIILRIVQLIYKRLEAKKHDYSQIEALLSLYHHTNPQVVLPPMRNHAGSPDFLNLIIEMLMEKRPKVVFEAGSGISSLVISEWLLANLPDSIHIALDHEKKYADLTRQKIRNPNSKIIFAPLKDYQDQSIEYRWYDLEGVAIPQKIDLLIVDGPPTPRSKHARLPAPYLLGEFLENSVTIILDDAIREDEQQVASLWERDFGFSSTFRPLEKGAYILNRSISSSLD